MFTRVYIHPQVLVCGGGVHVNHPIHMVNGQVKAANKQD